MVSIKKHNVLNIEMKSEVLEKLDKGESRHALAKLYYVEKSTTIGHVKRKTETILLYA